MGDRAHPPINELRSQVAVNGSLEELHEYVEQLLKTDRFRKSPSLRQLLEYLVRKTAEGKVDEIKESTIAMDVFGRSHDFDGRLDNIVRVQAHRLRKILETYYETEGSHDKFGIAIPKGGYIPTIHHREETVPAEPLPAEPPPPLVVVPAETRPPDVLPPLTVAPAGRPRPRVWLPLGAAFLAGALMAALLMFWAAPAWISRSRLAAGSENVWKPPLSTFWQKLLQPGVNCVVSFTNPAFLWTPTSRGRAYFTYQGPLSAPVGTPVDVAPGDSFVDPDFVRPGRKFFFSDSWTGTGEVFGIYRLTRLFGDAGHPLKILRSRALTYEDLRDSNVVFLGSPWANELQNKINPGRTPLASIEFARITNYEPRPGEESVYQSGYDPQTQALVKSYTLISVLPGVTAGYKMVSSAGIDTYGTAAGIDFLTSAAGLNELIQRFDPQERRRLPEFFQAVIQTEIVRGDPARSTVILVRDLGTKAGAGLSPAPAR
jgi:hypothetical protein